MNLRLLSAKMGAFVKRDFIIASSYRLNFVLNAFYSLFIVTLLFFIGGMVDPGTRGLGEYGGSYFAFAVIGYGFYQYFNLSLSTFSSAVQREQLTGCLEAMVGTQTRPETSILLSSLYALLSSLLELAVILVAGFLVFGVEIRSVNIASTALAFVLSIGVFTAFGILSAAFIIVLKKGDPLSWLFTTLNFILGGAFFPIEQMPDWMRSIAYFVPATYSLRALRAGILNGQGIAELAVPLLVLAAIAAVMLPLSLLLFRRAVWKAKREGTLVLY
jgi:ABC-2 type transport system permease protein